MNDIASVADGRNGLIERAYDLPFGYCATFFWRRPDTGRLCHASASRARCENFLRPTKPLGASSLKMSPWPSAAELYLSTLS